ncbi:hypothetical protein [Haliea sp. E17]|uniref:hypothetical protein n=1 Tax=Haliea sp. E17 TaxID=3401576 RepID=UPI003AAE628D
MRSLLPLHRFRFARLLALAALLCVAGLQLHELDHWHSDADTASHCLVCKSTTGLAVNTSSSSSLPQFGLLPPLRHASPSFESVPRIGFLARGPPHFS